VDEEALHQGRTGGVLDSGLTLRAFDHQIPKSRVRLDSLPPLLATRLDTNMQNTFFKQFRTTVALSTLAFAVLNSAVWVADYNVAGT
jgi:hypothetical protein